MRDDTELRVRISAANRLTIEAALEQYPDAVSLHVVFDMYHFGDSHWRKDSPYWRPARHYIAPSEWQADGPEHNATEAELDTFPNDDDITWLPELETNAWPRIDYYNTHMPHESAPGEWTMLSEHRYGYYAKHHTPDFVLC